LVFVAVEVVVVECALGESVEKGVERAALHEVEMG
jgi:hypothetical protein